MSPHVKHGVPPVGELPPSSPAPLEILPKATFDGLGIKQNIIDILAKLQFNNPTPIQAKTIPLAIPGQDVLGIAQTGTGKTLAFGIPMVQKLSLQNGMGLILVPTRELALQVYESLSRLSTPLNISSTLIIGGESMSRQIQNLRRNPRVIIATPGRLNDHLRQRTVKLDRVSVFVLDEADRMLDMGFAPQIKEIIKFIPAERQTMLFSATMPAELTKLAHSFMKEPLRIEIAPQGSTVALISQELFFVSKQMKPALLMELLKKYQGSVLVFSRTKFGAKRIAHALVNNKISSAEIHSNRSQAQRKAALEGFKRGTYRVLVATDIAARGIHVTGIELVINYDLPENPADYVHRIGRTGRAGKTGHAISFASPDQRNDVRDIERLMKKILKVTPLPVLPTDVYLPADRYEETPRRDSGRRPFGGRGGSSRPFAKSSYGSRDSKPSTGGFGASKPSYGNRDSKPSTGGYGAARPSTGSYGSARPSTGGYGSSKPSTGGYSSPKTSGSYGSARPSTGTYTTSRPPSHGAGQKSYGDRKPFGDKKPYSTGDRKPYGDKKPFGQKPAFGAASTGDRKFSPRRPDRNNRNKYPGGYSKLKG